MQLRQIGEYVEYDVHVKISSYNKSFLTIGPIVKEIDRPRKLNSSCNATIDIANKLPKIHPRKQDPV